MFSIHVYFLTWKKIIYNLFILLNLLFFFNRNNILKEVYFYMHETYFYITTLVRNINIEFFNEIDI